MNREVCYAMSTTVKHGTVARAETKPRMPSDKRVIEYQRDPDAAPDHTGAKQDTRFKPGVSGNPAGRPKGARSRLGEEFVEALAADFEEHGAGCIAKVRAQDTSTYLKLISNILPRETLVRAFSVHADINVFGDANDLADAREFAQAFKLLERHAKEVVGVIEVTPEKAEAK